MVRCALHKDTNMPITSSAIKALRASKRKRVFNLRRQSAVDTKVKQFRKLLADKKVKDAAALVPSIYQALDKAAKTGYIKANTAGRTKSRISSALNKAGK